MCLSHCSPEFLVESMPGSRCMWSCWHCSQWWLNLPLSKCCQPIMFCAMTRYWNHGSLVVTVLWELLGIIDGTSDSLEKDQGEIGFGVGDAKDFCEVGDEGIAPFRAIGAADHNVP
jgi:hypothetical protein